MRYGLKAEDVEAAAWYIMARNAEAYSGQAVGVAPDLSELWHYNLDGPGSKYRYGVESIKRCARSWRQCYRDNIGALP